MIRPTTILLASLLAAASPAALPEEHDAVHTATAHDTHHTHHPDRDTEVAPPEGTLWPTDEPLRVGMSRIQAAIAETTTRRPISRESARELARTIAQNVTYIVEHCDLPPEPDAALHALIARMMAAVNRLNEDTSAEAGIAQMQSALHDYRATFDHPYSE